MGPTGMLGSAVYNELKDKYQLVLALRDPEKIKLLEEKYGGTEKHRVVSFDASLLYQDFLNKKGYPGEYLENFLKEVGEAGPVRSRPANPVRNTISNGAGAAATAALGRPASNGADFVINAIGITIPFSLKDPAMTFFINSAMPHILSRVWGEKMIHITTDCSFNGKEGFPYDENSPKTPVDIYGLSKSLGEPENCLTLRTSIIGRELESFTGLLDWFLQQGGRELTGFSEHYWNGITTKQFGKICDKIMENRNEFPKTGIYHVFSNTVSKYEMLLEFEKKYKIGCAIKANGENKLNRTLSTVKNLNVKLNIPSFGQMIDEL